MSRFGTSLIYLIRYPFYGLRAFNYELYAITWLRYNAWIVLYPLGFICEGQNIQKSNIVESGMTKIFENFIRQFVMLERSVVLD